MTGKRDERLPIVSKKILVICGAGIVSSTICGQKITKWCQERGVHADVQCIALREIQGQAVDADLIVTVLPEVKIADIPVFNGTALLSGMGEHALFGKIGKALGKRD